MFINDPDDTIQEGNLYQVWNTCKVDLQQRLQIISVFATSCYKPAFLHGSVKTQLEPYFSQSSLQWKWPSNKIMATEILAGLMYGT